MHVVRCREEISYTSPVNYWEKPTPRKKVEREVGGRGIRERKVQKCRRWEGRGIRERKLQKEQKSAFQPEKRARAKVPA